MLDGRAREGQHQRTVSWLRVITYADALPARHVSHGMFQSPSPSVPDSVSPTVLMTSTMSPRLVVS